MTRFLSDRAKFKDMGSQLLYEFRYSTNPFIGVTGSDSSKNIYTLQDHEKFQAQFLINLGREYHRDSQITVENAVELLWKDMFDVVSLDSLRSAGSVEIVKSRYISAMEELGVSGYRSMKVGDFLGEFAPEYLWESLSLEAMSRPILR